MVFKWENGIALRFRSFRMRPLGHKRGKRRIPWDKVSMVMPARRARAMPYRRMAQMAACKRTTARARARAETAASCTVSMIVITAHPHLTPASEHGSDSRPPPTVGFLRFDSACTAPAGSALVPTRQSAAARSRGNQICPPNGMRPPNRLSGPRIVARSQGIHRASGTSLAGLSAARNRSTASRDVKMRAPIRTVSSFTPHTLSAAQRDSVPGCA